MLVGRAWSHILVAVSSFVCLLVFVMDVLVAEVGVCSLRALLRHQEDPTHGHSLGICWDIMLKVSAPLCVWNNSEASALVFVCIQDKFPLLCCLMGAVRVWSLTPLSFSLFSLLNSLSIPAPYSSLFLHMPATFLSEAVCLGSPTPPPCSFPSGLYSSLYHPQRLNLIILSVIDL